MALSVDSEVSMTALLQEMIDRDATARIATPQYWCKQASSYDRTQIEVGGENWYANKDYDQYLRLETDNGRDEYVVMEDDGPGALRKFVVQIDPKSHPDVMRDLWVTMSFDGEETVQCPVSEFFGGGYFPKDAHPEKPEPDGHFIRPHWNRNRQAEKDGTLSCYFVMPYESSARVGLKNLGKSTVKAKVSVVAGEWEWDENSMHFHANWLSGLTPGKEADWNYVEIHGQGTYVADTLSVHNPSKNWYGEGDERIYIDGESFPSHLGTGTEDYYGYAWGMANVWSSSFISAPSRDSRGKLDWRGYQSASRKRMLDAIPFTTSLKFDMEVGCWFHIQATYSVGVMWYGRPGATSSNDVADQALPATRDSSPNASID